MAAETPRTLGSLDAYDYALPETAIAQHPSSRRDDARMLVLDRARSGSSFEHTHVRDLPDWLRAGDLLVVNTTRVQPARLVGRRDSGGAAEALLLGPVDAQATTENDEAGPTYRALVKISGRLRPGIHFLFGPEAAALEAEIISVKERGEVWLQFPPGSSPYSVGAPPLPPYIRRTGESEIRDPEDLERYQTVYARVPGAIAAPTAGLHFTPELLDRLKSAGIETAEVVLHVGPGTFRPLDEESLASGRLHPEHYELPEATAEAISRTRARGGRIVAVGTTSVRVLEANALPDGEVSAGCGETELFLRPGSEIRVVDALLTNFHLPRSSLLLLVASLAGREPILAAYHEALASGYRFYSYGDAMLIL